MWPRWRGVDKPRGVGICVRNMKEAARVKACMMAGKWFSDAVVATTVVAPYYTYVNATGVVRVRTLNAELKRLGF